jgi:hypothetical protein
MFLESIWTKYGKREACKPLFEHLKEHKKEENSEEVKRT